LYVSSSLTKTTCQDPSTRLVDLNLLDNKITDDGAIAIARALKFGDAPSSSTRLSLTGSFTVRSAAASIVSSGTSAARSATGAGSAAGGGGGSECGNNTTLRSLGLGGLITDAGAVSLAAALRSNRTLTNLRLVDCRIGDAGAIAFAELLTPVPRSIPIDPASVVTKYAFVVTPTEQAAAAARRVKAAHDFALTRAAFVDATACGGNDTLTGVHLNGNRFSDRAVERFARTLEGNTTLVGLGIDNSYCVAAGGAALSMADAKSSQSPMTSGARAIARVLESNVTLRWYRGPGGRRE
jgi:hypothetical protein